MKKRILSFLLAVCTAASLLAVPAGAAEAVGFVDVNDRSTAVAVECLRLMGVLDGYSDGTFRPGAQLTRAQFCKMAVYAMNGSEELGQYRTVTVFQDVKPSYWAAPYINMASKGKGIIAGYPNGRFNPGSIVTYGQAVTILMRMLGYQDEDMGGIWPDGYLASASVVGLTDGITSTGSAPLSRGQAARLFVNLLTCNVKGDGGTYAASVAASVREGVMLASSTATGADGKDNAMQLGSGEVFAMANTTSTGILNGSLGTLMLNKQNKVITFVPKTLGNSRTVTFASGTASRLIAATGESFSVNGTTPVYINGEQSTWSAAYSWMKPGLSLNLLIGDTGGVEYIFAGGGGSSSNAVIVYGRGSTVGFQSLAGSNDYTIYKNGVKGSAADLRPYDVATYSASTNSIRVCDTRITGYYEEASPNTREPSTIKVMGATFDVLPSAAETVSKFNLGQQVTFLLTEDNKIAGAVAGSGTGVTGNAVGIATVTASSATVDLLCGVTVSGTVDYSASTVNTTNGQLVRVSSSRKDMLDITVLSGGVRGDLDTANRKMGNRNLASNVAIYERIDGKVVPVDLTQIKNGIVNYSHVAYARENWSGQVDLIVLNNVTGIASIVGRISYLPTSNTAGQVTIDAGGTSYGPFTTDAKGLTGGDFVVVTLNGSQTELTSIEKLTELKNVSNADWDNQNSVTTGGRTYQVPSGVLCWNNAMKSWTSLESARGFAERSTLYINSSGTVLAMEVG